MKFNECYKTTSNNYAVVYFYDKHFQIQACYRLNRSERREISDKIISTLDKKGIKHRLTSKYVSGEWLGHKICYLLNIARKSTKDCDIEYMLDGNKLFTFLAKILSIFY